MARLKLAGSDAIQLDPRVAAALGLGTTPASAEEVAGRIAALGGARAPSREETRVVLLRLAAGVGPADALESLDVPTKALCATDLGLLDGPLEAISARLPAIDGTWELEGIAVYALEQCLTLAIAELTKLR